MYTKSENLKRLEELSLNFPVTYSVHREVIKKIIAIKEMVKNCDHDDIEKELDNLLSMFEKQKED